MDEFALIRMLTTGRQPDPRVVVDVGDDAAVVTVTPGKQMVLACDAMVEGVHFRRDTLAPEDVGYKSLAVNVSDVAAMGGEPRFALIALAPDCAWTPDELSRLYDGLYEGAAAWGVALVGGDTVRSPGGLWLSVTVVGEVEAGRALTRGAARPGDVVFVSGPLGLSAAGLDLLLRHPERADRYPRLVAAHRRPRPRLDVGRLCAAQGVRCALNDVSDGLASEAWEIAEASGVTVRLYADRLPVHPELAAYCREAGASPLDWMLFGGEDYELVGAVSAGVWPALARAARAEGVALVAVGEVVAGTPGVVLVEDGRERPLPKGGYNHFVDEGTERAR